MSDFGPGEDLLRNEEGGRLQAATDRNAKETSSIVRLSASRTRASSPCRMGERGTACAPPTSPARPVSISMTAALSSTPRATRCYAVDTFLGSPGSVSDIFIIDGNVSGRTKVDVNNTNPGPGVFNKTGIPVVFVGGSVASDAFFLTNPIDTGFFDYAICYSGPRENDIFELQSFLGPARCAAAS